MSTSRRRFLALGSSALCSLSLAAFASHASHARALLAGSASATSPPLASTMQLPRNLNAHMPLDVMLPLPRTCANAFGERRSHRRAATLRWRRAP